MLDRIQKTEVFFFVTALMSLLLWVAMVIASWGDRSEVFVIVQRISLFVMILALIMMQALRLIRQDMSEYLHRHNEDIEQLSSRIARLEKQENS